MAVFLFDMDGLLLDTERVHLRAFLEVTQRLGVASEGDTPFFLSLVGCSMKITNQRLAEYLPRQVSRSSFLAVWDEVAHERTEQAIPLRPHAQDVVRGLHANGNRLAVVTSTSGARARKNLEKAGLLQHFDLISGGDEVSANKPDPAPYRETAESLGVDPATCYAFEDSDHGITSAVAAGCIATQIPDLRPPGTPLPKLGQRTAVNLKDAIQQLGFDLPDNGLQGC